jgi:putative tributyrin esterase
MDGFFPTVEVSDPALTPSGVSHVTVKSPALGRRADVTVFKPAAADEGARGLPLVLLLHGVYGSHWAWMFKGAAHLVLERLIREEGLPPMVLGMPSDGLWGDGSGYLRHRAAGDHHRWIIEEAPLAVACAAPGVRGGPLFLCGLSMGGYGALRLGALHADKVMAVSGHSSVTGPEDLRRFVVDGEAPGALAETAPLDVLDCWLNLTSARPPLRFDCGTEDPLLASNRALHEGLARAGIAHEFTEHPGGHTWDYWREHLADSLRFFGAVLASGDHGAGERSTRP